MSIIYLPRSMSQSMITKRIIGKRLHQLGLTAEKVNGDWDFDEYLVMLRETKSIPAPRYIFALTRTALSALIV